MSIQLRAINHDWIIFDAVGTLIEPDPPVATAYARIGRRYGSGLDEAVVKERFHSAFAAVEDRDFAGDLSTSEEREHERWRKIVSLVFDDLEDTEACYRDLFEHFAQPSAWRCYDDVLPTLQDLKQAGFRLGIASNFDERLRSVLNGLPIGGLLELYVVSSTIGFRKPSPKFFEAIAGRAGVACERIVFVGDDRRNDIEPAIASGMTALQIDRQASESSRDCLTDLREIPPRLQ